MTLEATESSVRYVGNGAAVRFSFPFRAWDSDNVRVFVGDGETESDVTASVTIDVQPGGGTVTFAEPPAEGTVIVIMRSMPYTQEDSYDNGARFNPEEVEDRFDMDAAERQDLRRDVDRAVSVPVTSSMSGDEFVNSIYQARQDAVNAVDAIGGAEQVLAARDAVVDAMESAGEVTGASVVRSAGGSQTMRSLSERFGDWVNVKDYGALGDGTTDDATAIQTALATGKNVYFPAGNYIVGSTVYTTATSQAADLGGATLTWGGAADGGPIFDARAEDSRICNGKVRGGASAGTAVKLSGFRSNAVSLDIRGFKSIGILMQKTSGSGGSLAATLDNIFITVGDGNAMQSLPGGATGIKVTSHDNQFSNITVLRMNKSLHLTSGCGNCFVNCHFCAMYPDEVPSDYTGAKPPFTTAGGLADSYAIYYETSSGSFNLNVFTNCYFDNHKYVVYNTGSHSIVTQFSNCFSFYSSAWIGGTAVVDAFMCGGYYSQIVADGFNCQPGSHVNFFDAISSSSDGNGIYDYSGERYVKSGFTTTYNQRAPFLSQFRVYNGQWVRVVRTGQSNVQTANTPVVIGGFIIPNTTTSQLYRFTQATLKINNRGYSYAEFFIWYQGGELKAKCKTHHLTTNNYSIKIGSPESVSINGNASLFIPIYIVPKSDLSSNEMWASLDVHGNMAGYLVSSGNRQNWSSVSYAASIDPVEWLETRTHFQTGSESTLLSFDSMTDQGVYHVIWDSNTTNYPTLRSTAKTDGLLEVFRIGTAGSVSGVDRVIQRVTVGSTGTAWVRAQDGASSFTAWRAMTA